ncbi:hypothetical protein IT409_02860 [Candidatus Falkowbacteria bacterium]|nr:hypothetical protein [Candidatus Falkowbacteria bacterium]
MAIDRATLQGFVPYSHGYVALHGLRQQQKGKNLSATLAPNSNPKVDFNHSMTTLMRLAKKFFSHRSDIVYSSEEIELIPSAIMVHYAASKYKISTKYMVLSILAYSKILINYAKDNGSDLLNVENTTLTDQQREDLLFNGHAKGLNIVSKASSQMLFVVDNVLAGAPRARNAISRQMTDLFFDNLGESLKTSHLIL